MHSMAVSEKRIVIIGGGFAGVRAALNLTKQKITGAKIILISARPHFEYHAALYRVVAGCSPIAARVPLQDIFERTDVKVAADQIVAIDFHSKYAQGKSGSRYGFDFLALALGGETVYFDIPGLKEFSFGFKSIQEASRLNQHLHELFRACAISATDKEEDICRAHLVIVGGGTSGAELAGELAVYTKTLAKKHKLDPSLITIDLIEAAPRLLPALPEDISAKVQARLHYLGVNIFLNRTVVKEEIETVYLKDMAMKTKTVIWTAGVKPNRLYAETKGLLLDKKGRVVVDEFLQAEGFNNVFILGDAAATPCAGLAQTAIHDGNFMAETIGKKIRGRPLKPYEAKKPAYAIPVGPGWAAALVGRYRFYGRLGWWLRRAADLKFFFSILPLRKVFRLLTRLTHLNNYN
ncbi:MAG: NAD(P)/FAD-dependent oxidoreductase [Parcubacteria group bacterium]|nr:NAD(P)/FAD-dependent oxidoreductase [Parcubacteria group bacterium]